MMKTPFKWLATFSLMLALINPAIANSGTFIGVEGESVRGTATVTQQTITLSSDFRSSRGPDLFVYLGNDEPTKLIAKLKKRRGSQTYELPDGIDLTKFSAVFIHCKRYNHTFGRADLE